MINDDLKRLFEQNEQIARMADPLRELKLIDDPMLRVPEDLAARFQSPSQDIRAQMKALAPPAVTVPKWMTAGMDHEALTKQLEAFAEPMQQVAKQLAQACPPGAFNDQIKAFLEPFNKVQSWLDAFRVDEAERIAKWTTVLEEIQRQFEEWPQEFRAQLDVLYAKGWCLDPEMAATSGRDLASAFQKGEEEEAQQWLMAYFSARLDIIEKTLIKRHPTRAEAISDAFNAHREGRFRLSIPVLLAQADGVIHDRHQSQLYSKKPGSKLKQHLQELPSGDMRALMLAAFIVDIPLTRRTELLPEGFDGLNRHAVLHGTDPNYGTEINSLRAVSILNMASYLTTDEGDPYEEIQDEEPTSATDASSPD